MLSVVIPAYNEEKTIAQCLDAVCNQTIKQRYEIIVVDNNSTDKTPQIIKKYAKNYPIKYLFEKQKGSGAARAKGFSEAKGTYIFTTDADTIVPSEWLETMLSALKKPGVVAVTSNSTLYDESFVKRKMFAVLNKLASSLHILLHGQSWICGYSYGVSAAAYSKVGKINGNLKMLDDVDLSVRLANIGKIYFVENVCVITSGRRYQNGVLRGGLSYIKPYFQVLYLGKNAEMRDFR